MMVVLEVSVIVGSPILLDGQKDGEHCVEDRRTHGRRTERPGRVNRFRRPMQNNQVSLRMKVDEWKEIAAKSAVLIRSSRCLGL